MQQHIHVTHHHPVGFGLRSIGLGLAISLVFLVSCDFNGKTIPRYNTVQGEKRLPSKNSEFIGGAPAPAQQIMPAPDQTFMQVEPQSFQASQPVAPAAQSFEVDPRPIGFRDEDRSRAAIAQPLQSSNALPPAPVQAADPYNNPNISAPTWCVGPYC